jgi:hypothetical protein
MNTFVTSLAQESDVNEVILALSTPSGLDALEQILISPISADFARGRGAPSCVSFRCTILPLLKILGSSAFSRTVHYSLIGPIMHRIWRSQAIHGGTLFSAIDTCCSHAAEESWHGTMDLPGKTVFPEVISYVEVYKIAVEFLLRLIRVVHDSVSDPSFRARFRAMDANAVRPRNDAELERMFSTCHQMLDAVRVQPEDEARRRSVRHPRLTAAELEDTRMIANALNEADGPGEASPQGPRHDNDCTDFRRIAIIPTFEELTAVRPPYLPFHLNGGSHIEGSGVDRYLDCMFRLLREELIADIRTGISGFLNQNGLGKLGKDGYRMEVTGTSMSGEASSSGVRLSAMRNVNFDIVIPRLHQGVCIRVSFDQLPAVKKMIKRDKEQYWEDRGGKSLLERDTLVALMINSRLEMSADGVVRTVVGGCVLATVADRNVKDLVGDRCSVLLRIIDGPSLQNLLSCLSEARVGENLLLQVRGNFWIGIAPFLSTLQCKDASSLPFRDQMFTAPRLGGELPLDVPLFWSIRPRRVFDLRCILRENLLKTDGTRSIALESYDQFRRDLLAMSTHIVLDDTQIDAFAAAICRSLCLIQGPPGTGKTYVGVYIVLSILINSEHYEAIPSMSVPRPLSPAKIGPIVCVCFTNHALDQFLESLVKKGVALEQILRLGSRSKSDLISSRTINISDFRSPTMRRSFYNLKQTANEVEQQIATDANLDARNVGDADVLAFLEDCYPDHFDELIRPFESDGFSYAGGHVALLQDWLHGTVSVDVDDDALPRARYSLEELLGCPFVWDTVVDDRRALYDAWKGMIRNLRISKLPPLVERYNELVTQNCELDDAALLRACQTAAVIGLTTSGCARYQRVLRALGAKIVVCEEAGEVLEQHIVASVSEVTQQLILIGDHLQLRPKINAYALRYESHPARSLGHDLDISLFERLSISPLLSETLITLHTQRRMRPEIADLIRGTLYPYLEDGDIVNAYEDVRGSRVNLWFLDHNHLERSDADTAGSYANEFEAEMIVELVNYFVRQGYKKHEIAVLTPYLGQMFVLRQKLRKNNILISMSEVDALQMATVSDDPASGGDDSETGVIVQTSEDNVIDEENRGVAEKPKSILGKSVNLGQCVRLATVDNFQGEEAEIVLISTVRCNHQNRTGFLKIANRVNVMLSRAKHGMFILGSLRTIRGSGRGGFLSQVLDILEEKGKVGDRLPLFCSRHPDYEVGIRTPADFRTLMPECGCTKPCGARLPFCGHVCLRQCHPDDPDHSTFQCRQKCELLIPACQHPCERLCYEDCGGCKVPIAVQLPCGHTQQILCSHFHEVGFSVHNLRCLARVQQKMPLCSHTIDLECSAAQNVSKWHANEDRPSLGQNHPVFSCSQMCGLPHPGCGHACTQRCGDCTWTTYSAGGQSQCGARLHQKGCQIPCKRLLVCGHTCQSPEKPCHPADQCPPCSHQCVNHCRHSKCNKKCHESCATCAYECGWVCTNRAQNHGVKNAMRGPCPLPCGSGCIRLPCDERCDKLLACGHRCPSLCGEKCPDTKFCPVCASGAVGDQVVDLIMMSTLSSYDPDADGCSPLIVLPCQHVFSTETLDGHLNLSSFYEQDELGRWVRCKNFDELGADVKLPKTTCCPHCRSPIHGINRYGRILRQMVLELSIQKEIINAVTHCTGHHAGLGAISEKIDLALNTDVRALAPPDLMKSKTELQKIVREADAAWKSCHHPKQNPLRFHHEKEKAAIKKLLSSVPLPQEYLQVNPNPSFSVPSRLEIEWLWISTVGITMQFRLTCMEKGKPPKSPGKRAGGSHAADQSATSQESPKAGQLRKIFGDAQDKFLQLLQVCETTASNQSKNTHICQYLQLALRAVKSAIAARELSTLQQFEHAQQWTDSMKRVVARYHGGVHEFPSALKTEYEALVKAVEERGMTLVKKMAFDALAQDLGAPTPYGGHFYTCPNGHYFAIGECGGAMEVARCIECGAEVGGTSHRLLDTNRAANDVLEAGRSQHAGFDDLLVRFQQASL